MMSIPVPKPSDGFEWAQAPWGSVLRCCALLPYADHFFTAGSLTLRDDDREWQAVAAFAGVTQAELQLLRQVHGCTIVSADEADRGERPEADGVIAEDPRVALVVRVADCAPILMVDRRTGVVAAVHAGWRSTRQSIVRAAVARLQQEFNSRPADLIAAIGPSLGACCGEMGEEVLDAFRDTGHDAASLDRWFVRRPGRRPHFDLWRANRDQLEATGVPATSIHIAGLCTRTHAGVFHSYRADGAGAGRMAAVIRARRNDPTQVS